MSDDEYVPTTDEVREAYQASGDGLDFKNRYHERGAAFDRMIEFVRAQERERNAQAIEVKMRQYDRAQVGFSAIGDAYADAARIVRGEG